MLQPSSLQPLHNRGEVLLFLLEGVVSGDRQAASDSQGGDALLREIATPSVALAQLLCEMQVRREPPHRQPMPPDSTKAEHQPLARRWEI